MSSLSSSRNKKSWVSFKSMRHPRTLPSYFKHATPTTRTRQRHRASYCWSQGMEENTLYLPDGGADALHNTSRLLPPVGSSRICRFQVAHHPNFLPLFSVIRNPDNVWMRVMTCHEYVTVGRRAMFVAARLDSRCTLPALLASTQNAAARTVLPFVLFFPHQQFSCLTSL